MPGLRASTSVRQKASKALSAGEEPATSTTRRASGWRSRATLDRPLALEHQERPGHVRGKPEPGDAPAGDVREHHRDAREQRLAVLEEEAQGLAFLHHDHVRPPAGVLLAQEIDEAARVGQGGRVRQVEVLDLEVHGRAVALFDLAPEGSLHLGDGGGGRAQGEEEEHGRGHRLRGRGPKGDDSREGDSERQPRCLQGPSTSERRADDSPSWMPSTHDIRRFQRDPVAGRSTAAAARGGHCGGK